MTYPAADQLETLYKTHDEVLQRLTQNPVISAADLVGQHKNVLSRLASGFWGGISMAGREVLLNHEHHFVRSPAVIGDQQLTKALTQSIKDLSVDELRLRCQDLKRRAAEMESNLEIQANITTPGKKENVDLAALNVELNQTRNRLGILGHPETPQPFIWI